MLEVSILDLILLNIVSFCGGVFASFIFVFCCEGRRFERIALDREKVLDKQMNHQNIVYPPISPVLASAPPSKEVISFSLEK